MNNFRRRVSDGGDFKEKYTFDANGRTTINGYEFVDLGLPSGILWATCNIGTSDEHLYGDLYSWRTSSGTYAQTYGWNKYDDPLFTASLIESVYGIPAYTDVDFWDTDYNRYTYNSGIDVNEMRLPKLSEFLELIANTTITKVEKSHEFCTNGVRGFLFTAANGRYLYLPYCGFGDTNDGSAVSRNSAGQYWTQNMYWSSSDGYIQAVCYYAQRGSNTSATGSFVYGRCEYRELTLKDGAGIRCVRDW